MNQYIIEFISYLNNNIKEKYSLDKSFTSSKITFTIIIDKKKYKLILHNKLIKYNTKLKIKKNIFYKTVYESNIEKIYDKIYDFIYKYDDKIYNYKIKYIQQAIDNDEDIFRSSKIKNILNEN
jgi:hypothetical protein